MRSNLILPFSFLTWIKIMHGGESLCKGGTPLSVRTRSANTAGGDMYFLSLAFLNKVAMMVSKIHEQIIDASLFMLPFLWMQDLVCVVVNPFLISCNIIQ